MKVPTKGRTRLATIGDWSAAMQAFCLATLALVVVAWSLAGAYLRQVQVDAERVAASERSNVAFALAGQIEAALAQVDDALISMRHFWTDQGLEAFRAEDVNRRNIRDRFTFYEQFVIFNKNGDIVYTTKLGWLEGPFPAADSEHFFVHRDRPEKDAFFIGRPFFGRFSKRWLVQASRPIFDAEGRFNGVIAASIWPERFAGLHRSISLGPGGVIAVVRNTGEYVARTERHDEVVGTRLALINERIDENDGEIQYNPQVDGVDRVYTWRRAPNTPLLLYVGQPIAEIAAPAAALRLRVYGWLGGFTALSVGLLVALIYASRQKQRALDAMRESEQLFRGMFESSNAGICFVDLRGRYIDANDAFLEMVGRSRDELSGLTIADLTEPDDMAREQGLLAELIAGRRREYRVEKRCRLPSGGVVWLDLCASVVSNADGAPHMLVRAAYDISERKENEAALARSNADLEQFGYVASHDLRQPLRMVVSYLTLLERRIDGDLNDEAREFLQYARDGAKRMDQMLVSLLEYSRVGRIGEPMDFYDARTLLDEALLFLRPDVEACGATIDVSGEWSTLYAGRNEMVRLFQNLVANAIKYRPPGRSPNIVISAGFRHGHWSFSIADDGIGMPPDQMGRLFKVFQRLTSRDEYDGCGVGLAVCRKIVERHGGRIWAESAGMGKGAVFRFILPQSPAASSHSHADSAAARPHSAQANA